MRNEKNCKTILVSNEKLCKKRLGPNEKNRKLYWCQMKNFVKRY